VSQGEELFGLGDMEGAKAVFHQIIQREAKNIEALNNLGVIAFQQGKVDEALSYFRRALEIDPDHFESIENTGNCLLAKQDFTGAVEWLTRGLKLKPEDPGIRSALANCFSQIADFKKAEKDPLPSHPFHENQTVVGKTPAEMDGAKASEVERRMTP
jgi:Flp pilus assembly protein TadD